MSVSNRTETCEWTVMKLSGHVGHDTRSTLEHLRGVPSHHLDIAIFGYFFSVEFVSVDNITETYGRIFVLLFSG